MLQNFLHLYDNNRLIIIGLNEMLPGPYQRSLQIYVDKSKDSYIRKLFIADISLYETQVIHF